MIAGVAFCPHPPVLVPVVAGGAAGELEDLRAACGEAVRAVARPDRQLVLIGSAASSAAYSPNDCGTLAGFGVSVEVALGPAHAARETAHGDVTATDTPAHTVHPTLPVSLTIGAWLVQDALGPASSARAFSVGPQFTSSAAGVQLAALCRSREVALIVLGDGSACRSASAPGHLHEDGEAFDAAVVKALASGDATMLLGLDARAGAEQLAAGVPAWLAAGDLLAGSGYDARVLYEDAPYGVGYAVAAWTARG